MRTGTFPHKCVEIISEYFNCQRTIIIGTAVNGDTIRIFAQGYIAKQVIAKGTYSHLHLSAYNLKPGIVEGDRDIITGKFIKLVAINDTTVGQALATTHDFKSYTPITPFQKIHHYKAVLDNSFILGNGSLKAIFGFQKNQRQEYADILNENQYGLYFSLNTVTYDIRYILPEYHDLSISIGINNMVQNSQNKGTEFLIPKYN
ncbi:MAG: hypothetical protein A2W85_11325 [Bacteroidetes bacterium GWF2_41_31]|nr:MAG: hypothetical protein A2W85_11325 [Bacteroidetes bacterium GWF2_41_31]